jgi:outer membrane immunogenic protein
MKKLIVAAAILAASAAGASAADLGAVPYRPTPMITPAYDWSGFYWGGNGGWGTSRNCWDQVAPVAPFAFVGAEGCHNATGGTAGGQLGFRVQSYSWVFGLEAQGNWLGLRGSRVSNAFLLVPGDITNRSRLDAFGLFTGQVGYAWGDTLFYVKGGLAVTTARYSDIVTATGLVAASASDTRAGGTVGAGLEYGFFPGWSVAVEYDHFFMGTRNLQFSSLGVIAGLPPAGSGVFTDRIRQDVDLVTVRINYTFGGPAIAKY